MSSWITRHVQRLRELRWDRQREALYQLWAQARPEKCQVVAQQSDTSLIFLCEEFFHEDLRGFGGFGKTVKNVAEHFNRGLHTASGEIRSEVALAFPQGWHIVDEPQVRLYHDTKVVLRPNRMLTEQSTFDQYADLLWSLRPRLMISIDWYPSYSIPAYALSTTPLLIWIHDPRDSAEWLKIAAVPDELKFRGMAAPEELAKLADDKALSMQRLLHVSKSLNRKIIFAYTAKSLVARAESTYQIRPIDAHWLPNPIAIPALEGTEETVRPSLLYLGRMDAVKRPWIAFELARRHPEIDVVIAGRAHVPDLMEPWLAQYRDVSNLKFVGHVDGEQKDFLIRSCWGVLNTSVHEAEPVSFLEAFSYGKCVVSCHDPDGEVSRYGYYTGEVAGEGMDEEALVRFSEQIKLLLENRHLRLEKGRHARQWAQDNHTISSFRSRLKLIMQSEGL